MLAPNATMFARNAPQCYVIRKLPVIYIYIHHTRLGIAAIIIVVAVVVVVVVVVAVAAAAALVVVV